MKHSSQIFFPSFSLKRLITAWSSLSVQVVTLDTRHCSGASRNNPLCLTELWPKPVRNRKVKTWQRRRAFAAFLLCAAGISASLDGSSFTAASKLTLSAETRPAAWCWSAPQRTASRWSLSRWMILNLEFGSVANPAAGLQNQLKFPQICLTSF